MTGTGAAAPPDPAAQAGAVAEAGAATAQDSTSAARARAGGTARARAGGTARASTAEHRALVASFAQLCRIESPSGRERVLAEHVCAELRALGLEVHEDGAAIAVGSDCGNLLARVPADASVAPSEIAPPGPVAPTAHARAEPPAAAPPGTDEIAPRPVVLLCAHLDTVPLAAPVEPVVVDGFFENANDGILGADNKAAVAVLLAVARRARTAGVPVDVELLFTVGEEVALAGARAFDATRLRSDFGFVFDHASPIGEVIVVSPTHFRIEAVFRGLAAHAGIRPEDGRSAILAAARAVAAMPHGRLDEGTTVNVGTIAGGTALNVVADRCAIAAEVRAHDDVRAEEVVAAIVDRCHDAANAPDSDCDLDLDVQRTFSGYKLGGRTRALTVAEAALRSCGYEPTRVASGGGSDANALIANGVAVVNLANGTERNHQPDERVAVHELEAMLDVALSLLDEAALTCPPAGLPAREDPRAATAFAPGPSARPEGPRAGTVLPMGASASSAGSGPGSARLGDG